MKDIEKIIVDQILAAFTRIRALLFTMTIFCALILSNAYIECYSFDPLYIKKSGELQNELKKEIDEKSKTAIELS